jgi:hypothetical protein
MTLLNHIGVFILLFFFWNCIAILEDEEITFENIFIALKVTIAIYVVFEAFYWTFKIFF